MISTRRIRLVHPFPSVLDGIATAAIGIAAGGDPPTALRLGLAMTLIQFAIGTANDIVDAPFERSRVDKPVAAGSVSPRAAKTVAVACAAGGLALAAPSGPAVLAMAALGLGIGLAYDLRLKRTPWAWLALAVAIPLLVVYAWYGATGAVDPVLVVLVPAAGLAGASLALGNALVDPDRDRRAGLRTPVVALGPEGAWRVAAVLQAATVIVAAASLTWLGAGAASTIALLAGGAISLAGLGLARGDDTARRERGWELQAIGVAVMGAAWVAGAALR